MKDLLLRLRALFFRKQVEKELDDELDFHIEMQTRKNLTGGMAAEEAKRQARIQLGVGDAVKEECRDARGVGFVETLFQDIHYAMRGFRRTPLFALSVVGTISLGLGWTVAVFTIFNAYLLRPPAVRDPDSLQRLDWFDRDGVGHAFTWNQYQELRAADRAFTQVSAMAPIRTRLNGRFAQGMLVSGDWFGLVGVPALIGRPLLPGDARSPGTEPVLVLSYAVWQNRFASDSAILGRKLIVHGYPFEVVGVMPERFTGLDIKHPSDFWAPITMSSLLDGPNLFDPVRPEPLSIAGRLKAHMSVQQALAELTVWARGESYLPDGAKVNATPVSSVINSKVLRRPAGVLAAILLIAAPFLVVLLSACANVANMMLARAMSRQREIGIRLSLGAARSRLIRQLLTEAILLALPAAIAAFAISQGVVSMGVRLLFATIPANFGDFIHIAPIHPDAGVLGFTLAAAIVSALLFGLAPAFQATRLNLMQAAHGDFGGEFRPSRVRNALVVAQITVSALFLIVCGVFLRGANHVRSLDIGMRTRDVLEIEIQERKRPQVLFQLAADSGVGLFAAAANAPLDSTLPAAGARDGGPVIRLPYTYSSPEYFSLFEIPILRGRNFTMDEATAGVAVGIVSETAARRLWPNQDAIGRSIHLTPDPSGRGADRPLPPVVRVVGVSRDTLVDVMDDNQGRTCLYLTTSLKDPGNLFLARVQGDPEAAKQRLDAALDAEDPGTVERIDTMQAFVDLRDYPFRAVYWVSAALGGIALLFTLSGIYGVLSYIVAQRTKEIGIRVAMGASIRAVIRLVLSQCMRLAAWGVAIGVALALAAAKFASGQVTVDPFDGIAYFGGITIVLLACICAAYVPARRAAHVDPITTLRYD